MNENVKIAIAFISGLILGSGLVAVIWMNKSDQKALEETVEEKPAEKKSTRIQEHEEDRKKAEEIIEKHQYAKYSTSVKDIEKSKKHDGYNTNIITIDDFGEKEGYDVECYDIVFEEHDELDSVIRTHTIYDEDNNEISGEAFEEAIGPNLYEHILKNADDGSRYYIRNDDRHLDFEICISVETST